MKPLSPRGVTQKSRLKRRRNILPAAIRRALSSRGLMKAYRERPAYQRNDYLGWIAAAKRSETRVAQMLKELEGGTRYMNMRWKAPR
jgi:hypothetical protein